MWKAKKVLVGERAINANLFRPGETKKEHRTSNVQHRMGKDEETKEIKLQSGATSLFDVQRWTFDVRRSSFKPTLHGIIVTCECLQNILAPIGQREEARKVKTKRVQG